MSEFFDDVGLEVGELEAVAAAGDPGKMVELTAQSRLHNTRFPPLATRTLTNPSTGVATEIICNSFADRHFFVVSQTRKFGSLVSAWSEERLDGSGRQFFTRVLQGRRDDELLEVYARQLAARLADPARPLLLAIGLDEKGRDADTFRAVLKTVAEMHGWAEEEAGGSQGQCQGGDASGEGRERA